MIALNVITIVVLGIYLVREYYRSVLVALGFSYVTFHLLDEARLRKRITARWGRRWAWWMVPLLMMLQRMGGGLGRVKDIAFLRWTQHAERRSGSLANRTSGGTAHPNFMTVAPQHLTSLQVRTASCSSHHLPSALSQHTAGGLMSPAEVVVPPGSTVVGPYVVAGPQAASLRRRAELVAAVSAKRLGHSMSQRTESLDGATDAALQPPSPGLAAGSQESLQQQRDRTSGSTPMTRLPEKDEEGWHED